MAFSRRNDFARAAVTPSAIALLIVVVVVFSAFQDCQAFQARPHDAPSSALTSLSLRRSPSSSGKAAEVPSSLLGIAADVKARRDNGKRVVTIGPKGPEWFGGFSKDESTYTEPYDDAVAQSTRVGYELPGAYRARGHMGHDLPFFHESVSGGDKAAWMTKPEPGASILRNDLTSEDGQDNVVHNIEGDQIDLTAPFFDDLVTNYDGFGRQRAPAEDTRRFLRAEGWRERKINKTIQCAEAGCSASTILDVFDVAKEEVRNCLLDIDLHPTDYDGDYWSKAATGENAHTWIVNGALVSGRCSIMARGCNLTAWRPLYPCVSDFEVDHLMSADGSLVVNGSISRAVDECPYEGNLLSGVVVASCMVRNKTRTTTTTTTDAELAQVAQGFYAGVPLRCRKPGCTSRAIINLPPAAYLLGSTCYMNISVNQTDFDATGNLPEEVLNISVLGRDTPLVTNAKPGKNPCSLTYEGKQPSEGDRVYLAVSDENVTAELLAPPAGSVVVLGSISKAVDECATEAGYLLDGWVSIYCEPPGTIVSTAKVSLRA
eukprot:TRINITY_DN63283_c0_g1_i1.p1 TRINITY_DN63283_c0_g1~~TRINITY_DN63283_c0_g1_i1.p1  ORF type:complete len:545 (+),score=93.52 TRINITY_DN63283_c0_g1_i1:105-1739(+)